MKRFPGGEEKETFIFMRYGFVIDHNRCIGCHACTVACKEEHNVPIGVYRTWVKYVEKGEFPHTRRHFSVLRCNHCDNAPCVTICPTVALFRRADGIVDFDGERCIGCKSCMQACPYDALYIDPHTNTAAKCNYCAHRVEVGLEPACVIVCPEQAIIAGDLDDPNGKIGQIVAAGKVSARKPEKGTRPKLFYKGVEGDLLQPTMIEPQSSYLWADKYPGEELYALKEGSGNRTTPGAAREVYDVPHSQPWGKKIASYLWTKSIAAGVLMVAALLIYRGYGEGAATLALVASPIVALAFLAATVALLVFDLKRPDRFYYLLTKPNPRSWLVLGGYLLIGYALFAVLWLLFGWLGGFIPTSLLALTVLLALSSAGYSAFLFAQAKGRDLWQSPLFLWHLLVQAAAAGAGALILLASLLGADSVLMAALGKLLGVSLLLSLAMILGELSLTHVSEDFRRATELLKKGALRANFWGLGIGMGFFLPLVLLVFSGFQNEGARFLYVLAALFSLFGLWVIEDLWIKAGQAAPLS